LSEKNFEDVLRQTFEDPSHIDFLVSKFRSIDINGDGVLDEEEIKQMLAADFLANEEPPSLDRSHS
jgi:hypothetical protein